MLLGNTVQTSFVNQINQIIEKIWLKRTNCLWIRYCHFSNELLWKCSGWVSVCLVNDDDFGLFYAQIIVWLQVTLNKAYKTYELLLCPLKNSKAFFCALQKKKSEVWIWNEMRVSKWQISCFWMNYPFTSDIPSPPSAFSLTRCLLNWLRLSLMLSFAVSISLSHYTFCLHPLFLCNTRSLLLFPLFHFLPSLAISPHYSGVPFYIFLSLSLSPSPSFQSLGTHSHIPFIPSLWLISIGQRDLRATADHIVFILIFFSHRTPPPPSLCDFRVAVLSSAAWAVNCLSQHIISRDSGERGGGGDQGREIAIVTGGGGELTEKSHVSLQIWPHRLASFFMWDKNVSNMKRKNEM